VTITPLDPDIVGADLRPPPLADLARRARRRRQRLRVTGVAAVISTLAAAAVLAGTLGSGRPVTPATTEWPEIHGDPIVLNRTSAVWLGQTGCGVTMRLTIDSGRTWTPPGGPPALKKCTPGVSPMPSFTYTIVGFYIYRVTIEGTAWFTRDAGRTWTTPPAGDVVAEAFASGSQGASLECVSGCDRPRMVDPATGQLQAIRTDLPFPRLLKAVHADQSTIWAVGAPEPGLPLRATHSNDLGRTWSPPADLPTTDENLTLLATGPRRAYVVSNSREGRGPAVHRTDDGGRTWTELDLPTQDLLGLAENARGRLLLTSWGAGRVEAWLSTDAGASFTGPMPVDAPDPKRGGTGAGLVWVAGSDNLIRVNDDGTAWHTIEPPA
jgi:photosystem II stability/assembly factor-like uncharacterized protein